MSPSGCPTLEKKDERVGGSAKMSSKLPRWLRCQNKEERGNGVEKSNLKRGFSLGQKVFVLEYSKILNRTYE